MDRRPEEGETPRLFAEFLTRQERGSVDFEAFCAEHAECAEDLRALHRSWILVDDVIRRMNLTTGLSARRTLSPGGEPFSEVLKRLGERTEATRRYTVRGEIARGGMGTILRVWDEDLRRHLAMKVVRSGAIRDGEDQVPTLDSRVVARLLEEAQVTGQLDHPGIVPVHEIGLDENGRLFFTMQLVAGRELEKIIELAHEGREDWTRTRVVSAILKVCEAMAYAHHKGVIHRDLKPANIMVGGFGEVYVMDWGLARVQGREDRKETSPRPDPTASITLHTDLRDVRDSQTDSPLVTQDGDVMGTPAFMSPEQARGDLSSMGPPSDIYSVGAILYFLLAGHMPYLTPGREVNAIEALGLLRAGPPEPIHEQAPDAPPELCAICEKAMAREPKDRFANMEELASDLRNYLEGRVVRAYETGAGAEFRKWVVRNKALSLTSLSAIVLILAGTTTASIILSRKNEDLGLARDESLASAAHARKSEASVLRLSDVKRLQQLLARSEELWPASPGLLDEYTRWLDDARALIERLPLHEQTLAHLRERAQDSAATPGSFVFATAELQWQHDTLAELTRDLRDFEARDFGSPGDVERRLAFASTVSDRSVDGDEARRLWNEVIGAIADPSRCPEYGGLSIRPQLGLLPLGRDPVSGLFEFAHLQSGEPPRRNPGTGALELGAETGLVFVLLPGGEFSMGAADSDPDADFELELPSRVVRLDPFFLSKYEMTQGQWLRHTGRNPSIYGPDHFYIEEGRGLLHSVEQVSWNDCSLILRQLGLCLPTEAQWEYGTRGGTTTPWWCGPERESLLGQVNLSDRTAEAAGARGVFTDVWLELDDGYVAHAEVDTFSANPFGLHHVHGNVWEWCADRFGFYGATVPRDGDGLREAEDSAYRANRGGSFQQGPAGCRSSRRNNSPPETMTNHLGVRPARPLERP